MRKLFIIFLLILMASVVSAQWPYDNKPMLGEQLDQTHQLGRPVGFWLMNEGSGDKVFDLSGNGNTGTFVGTAPSWSAGKFGSAVLLPGTDEYIDLTDFTPTAGGYTFSMWVNKVDIVGAEGVMGKTRDFNDGGVALKYGYGMAFHDELLIGIAGNNNQGWYDNLRYDYTGKTNEWHHLAFTITGMSGTQKGVLYVDGIEVDNYTGTAGYWNYLFTIGCQKQSAVEPAAFFEGQIDLPILYHRALSASEIALLHREPFCMFETDDVALMAEGAAPAPTGSQVIMITSLPVIFFGLYLCRKYKAA